MKKKNKRLLTDLTEKISSASTLTSNVDMPFILCFKDKLENNYTFKNLNNANLREFQSFLDKVSKMTISQVDKSFLRFPDTDDLYNKMQIQHYEVSKTFRIHGYWEKKLFHVIRLDPKHQYHN